MAVTGPMSASKALDSQPGSAADAILTVVEYCTKEAIAFRILSTLIPLSFVASTSALIYHAFFYEEPAKWAHQGYWWWCGESTLVYLSGVGFLYIYFLITLFEWKDSPTIAHLAAWGLSFAAELTLAICSLVRASSCHHVPPGAEIPTNPAKRADFCFGGWEQLDLGLYVFRACILLGLCVLYVTIWSMNCKWPKIPDNFAISAETRQSEADETTPLLVGATKSRAGQDNGTAATTNGHATNGGSPTDGGVTESDEDEAAGARKEEQTGFYRPKKLPKKSWWEYISGYSVFFPYLWPKGDTKLQLIVTACFILLVFQRVVNILVPMQVGLVTEMLLSSDGGDWHETFTSATFPLKQLIILGAYWGLQGSGGLLSSLRSLMWIQVSQYSYRGLTTAAFEHVHSLSLDFHLGKRTGEVLSALNKGSSINQFLEQVTFNVVPMLVDLLVAIYFFWYHFGPTFAALIGVNTFWYLYLTVRMAQTRADQRREMTNADREEEAVKNDSITSYETVKYFNAETYEFNRYRNAINDFQRAEAQVSKGTNRMSIAQALVYNGGRVLAAILGAWKVSNGTMTVGDFSALLAYLAQLQGPLNFFGTFYRQVQQAMISGERLLELFKIQPTVVDGPDVEKLTHCSGRIRWSNVSFSYGRKPALKKVDFECEPGTTTAFVGESGGGKSTVFRLMFRYYNTCKGRIEFDGRDVKDLTIDSVRRFIGVVPQDTTLFNDTLMFNLKYANQDATDEDVYNACRAASIHDRIMSFPDKYSTKVGERGLRLSGGEKQRVAIARTILKNPKIIMLDEATSALDTNTEQQIQDKLGSLGLGRTLLIIAHRLSTITHADQIIVLHDGRIDEKGTHEELLAKKGRYAEMWDKQIRAERAEAEARIANRKAHELMRRANIMAKKGSDSRSDGYNSLTSSQILENGSSKKDGRKLIGHHEGDTSSSSSSSSDSESTHNGRD